jgi:hypothetical protein
MRDGPCMIHDLQEEGLPWQQTHYRIQEDFARNVAPSVVLTVGARLRMLKRDISDTVGLVQVFATRPSLPSSFFAEAPVVFKSFMREDVCIRLKLRK